MATIEDKPCAFFAFLPMPSGTVKNAWRCSRIVVLPEFQGMGIGYKATKTLFSMYKSIKRRMYIRTINPALVHSFKRDRAFKYNGYTKSSPEGGQMKNRKIRESKAHSFEYIGDSYQGDCSKIQKTREQILDNNLTFDF